MTDKMFLDPPEEAEPVLEAAVEQKLVIQRCASCGTHQFYPRVVCKSCGAPDPEWVEASGRGAVHTFTVIHANRTPGWSEELPYVVAVIELAEGARITTNVVDVDPAEVEVGMEVEVTFRTESGVTLPRFRPA